jgi:hypothetical protein
LPQEATAKAEAKKQNMTAEKEAAEKKVPVGDPSHLFPLRIHGIHGLGYPYITHIIPLI